MKNKTKTKQKSRLKNGLIGGGLQLVLI